MGMLEQPVYNSALDIGCRVKIEIYIEGVHKTPFLYITSREGLCSPSGLGRTGSIGG